MEENPLEIKTTEKKNNSLNKRGRPVYSEVIEFSPQPQSIIISEIKTRTRINTVPNENVQVLGEVTEEEFVCNTCSKSNKNVKDHKNHLRSHKKDQLFTCDFAGCSYSCKLSCNLIKHKRVHTSEKPYICDKCPFRTNFVNSFKVHKRIHTAERPYGCKHCAYRCNSSSNLKKHCLHKHSISQDVNI